MPKKGLKKLKIRVEKKRKTGPGDNLAVLEKKTEIAEKKKLLIMQISVVGLMVVFFTAWIFSLKYQFKANANSNSQSSFNWPETKAELDKAMSQVKDGLKEIKQIQAARPVNTLPRQPELTPKQLDLLKGRLMNETASGTKKIKNAK